MASMLNIIYSASLLIDLAGVLLKGIGSIPFTIILQQIDVTYSIRHYSIYILRPGSDFRWAS